MRLPHLATAAGLATTLALTVATAPAAFAGDPGTAPRGPDVRPEWQGGPRDTAYGIDGQEREDWLAECRRHIPARDKGVGGAAIGGLVGGLAGNRIAGRGNRTVGTVAGAAIGAAAGLAIDKAEDRGRTRDECENYLDSYYAYYAQSGRTYAGYGYPAYGYPAYNGYGYPGAPMTASYPRPEPECTETIEYVYEDVPAPARARRISSKRVKIAPDKRIRVN